MSTFDKLFKIGQYTDPSGLTGCSVIISEAGATPGYSVRGGSPNTRDTDALRPENNRKAVHGVSLSGGSAFGLATGDGIVQYLEERGIGREIRGGVVPNVVGASLFDLGLEGNLIRPDREFGYRAAELAFSEQKFQSGNHGAGAGATVGTIKGMAAAMKGGIGFKLLQQGELFVAALIAVNAVGDIFEEEQGRLIAGLRGADGRLASSSELFLREYQNFNDLFSGNTVIGCVMTNGKLDKARTNKLADISHNGIARSVRPSHTTFDGDTLFALAAGEVEATFEAISIMAVEAVRLAVIDGVKSADTVGDLLSYRGYWDLSKEEVR